MGHEEQPPLSPPTPPKKSFLLWEPPRGLIPLTGAEANERDGELDLRAARREPGQPESSRWHWKGRGLWQLSLQGNKALNSAQVMLSPTRALGVGRISLGAANLRQKRAEQTAKRRTEPAEWENFSNTPQPERSWLRRSLLLPDVPERGWGGVKN